MASSTRTIQVKLNGDASGLARSAAEAYAALRKVGQDTTGMKKAQADAEALARELDKNAADAKDKGSLIGGALALGVSAAAPLVSAALIGGVSLGLVGVVALVQKGNKQVQANFSDLSHQVITEMTSVTDQAAPALAKSEKMLQQTFANLGPQLDQAFSAAGPDITALTGGVDALATNAMPGLVTAAKNSQPVMQGLATLLGDVGTTVSTVFTDVSQHSDVLERDLDKFGGLIKNVGGVLGGVLPGLASGFGSTVSTANTMLSVLKPVAPVLGDITGQALPAIGAFKLFGLATAPLNKFGSSVTTTGQKVGIYAAKLTNSASIGEKVTKATSKMGSALGSLGNVLPIAGVGFALLGDAMSAAANKQQAVLQGLVQGGAASKNATAQITAAAPTIAHLSDGFKQGEGNAAQFSDALNVATKNMDPLQKATAIYNADLDQFGAKAPQTITAQHNLAAATDANRGAQQALSNATQDANLQLLHQTDTMLNAINSDLGLQSSILSVTQAQKTYASSVKTSGKNSLQSKQASIAYQQSLIGEINAAEAAALAHHTNASASQQAKIQEQAETGTILGLAAAAGKNAPPALKQMVAGLNSSEIAAFAATGKIAGTRTEVLRLPNGKTIKIQVNSNGQAVTGQTQAEIDHMRGRAIPLTAVDHVTGTVNQIIRQNSGKVIHVELSTSGGAISLGHRAGGGPVTAGMPYIVGERRAELFVPKTDGTILPSVPIASSAGGDTFDLVIADQVIASIVDGRLRQHNRTLVSRVKAGSRIR
jgi:hypothetical protein